MLAIQDADLRVMPEKYFRALCGTPEEGKARFNLHENRMNAAMGGQNGSVQ